jgi:hypothetical protein
LPTAGETLVLTYNEKKYSLEILEVAPGRAVSLIDTNINLDFAPPLIGEIKPLAATTAPTEEEKKEAQVSGSHALCNLLCLASHHVLCLLSVSSLAQPWEIWISPISRKAWTTRSVATV